MDIADILRQGVKALEDGGVPAEWRSNAFPTVIGIIREQASPTPGDGGQGSPGRTPNPAGAGGDSALAGDATSRIARELGLDVDVVKDVYHDNGTHIEIVVANSKLSSQKALATREIALLLVAGQKLGGYTEDYTPLAAVRRACDEHKRLDSGNFAKALADYDALSLRGKDRNREAKLSRPGREQAKVLIARLGGADS